MEERTGAGIAEDNLEEGSLVVVGNLGEDNRVEDMRP